MLVIRWVKTQEEAKSNLKNAFNNLSKNEQNHPKHFDVHPESIHMSFNLALLISHFC